MSEQFFETIKTLDEEVLNLQYHNARVARTIGLNINLHDYIFPPSEELLRCKLIYDESGVLSVEYFPYQKREIESFKLVFDDNIDYSKKKLDRSDIDTLFEKRGECDEIIIVKNALITDTSIANIAVLDDGIWFTPKTPLLKGTTRARLLDEGFIKERDIDIDMLKSVQEIALMNAMVDFDIKKNYEIS